MAVAARSFARVGLLGNPSDGFHGKTLGATVRNWAAEVTLEPRDDGAIALQDAPPLAGGWPEARECAPRDFRDGAELLAAACKVFARAADPDPGAGGFSLRFATTVPRQVGLAGSSAIVSAAFKALLQFSGAQLPEAVVPQLVLDAEVQELGIAAGLQDRVVQMYGGLVFMDFDREFMAAHGHGRYERLPAARLPPLHLAFEAVPSDSGAIHSDVRARWQRGDPAVAAAMAKFGALAQQARDLLLLDDAAAPDLVPRLQALMRESFAQRRALYALHARHERMVDIAAEHGAAAKYPGSGGAVVVLCEPAQVEPVRRGYEAEGFEFVLLAVG